MRLVLASAVLLAGFTVEAQPRPYFTGPQLNLRFGNRSAVHPSARWQVGVTPRPYVHSPVFWYVPVAVPVPVAAPEPAPQVVIVEREVVSAPAPAPQVIVVQTPAPEPIVLPAPAPAPVLAAPVAPPKPLAPQTPGNPVYTWTDGDGVVHYSTRPDKNSNAKKL